MDRQPGRTTDSPRGNTGHDGDNSPHPLERPGREAAKEGEKEVTARWLYTPDGLSLS